MKTRFDLAGRIDGAKRTPQGGIKASANLTRVGVFTYHNADGSKTRELRHPDDVFKDDALETLRLAPLTVGHPGMVTSENYKELSVGIVAADVRADGKFVKSTILVQDAETCRRVELGVTQPNHPDALVELSCGYEVEVEAASGEYEGETFDSKQTGHKYNHVALGPANWGRAGAEVRLTLDSAGNGIPESYSPGMLKTDDNKDVQARLDALTGERDSLKADLTSTKAKLAETESELVRIKNDTKDFVDPKAIPALVSARVALETAAHKILPPAEKLDGKTDREVMTAVLAKARPTLALEGKSDDYVRACFDSATEHATAADAAVLELGKSTAPTTLPAGAAGPSSKIDEANEKAAKAREDASKAGAPPGAMTRKG